MHSKRIFVALVAAATLGLSACTNTPTVNQNTAIENQNTNTMNNVNNDSTGSANQATTTTDTNTVDTAKQTGTTVKETTMTSFYEMVDGQPKPQFSVKEIKVKKGDLVRIKVTNTKGMHDINIDEFNIHKATPLDEEVVIEFVADKTGDFVYYCSMPGHRAGGHWGTLRVE